MWGLLTILVVITYFIQRYRWHLVPPSGIAMVLGMVAGLIFRLSGAWCWPQPVLLTHAHPLHRLCTQPEVFPHRFFLCPPTTNWYAHRLPTCFFCGPRC